MGGTDGQLVKRAPNSDMLYMTYGIVGYHPKQGSSYAPDPDKKINKTVLLSSNGGGTWSSLGLMDGFYWRLGMAPLSGRGVATPLVFSGLFANGSVFTGKPAGSKYEFSEALSSGGKFRYTWRPAGNVGKYVYTNVSATAVIGRIPAAGNQLVLVYPSAIDKKGNAARMYFYNADAEEFSEADPIVPEDIASGYIMHPTLIDSKTGPLLLYWYDLNGSTMKGKIKGRIISGKGIYTDDFDISTADGKASSFNLTQTENFWYGDYHTADGYVGTSRGMQADTKTVNFYPVWMQPDGNIRYGKVSYTYQQEKPKLIIPFKEIKLEVKEIPPHIWVKPLQRKTLQQLNPKDIKFEIEERERH